MKGIIIDFDEVTDSSEVYEEKPHGFLTFFVIFVAVCFFCGIAFMVWSTIEVTENVTGIIALGEKTYVNILVSGYDASGIKKGMEVSIDLRTCSKAKEAGVTSGEIVYISSVPEKYDEYGNGYYGVVAKLDLTKNMVEKLNLREGTSCQGKIITNEKNMMSYVLEKLNIIN